eukprot:SAG31_NODE_618_length_13513_cov_87.043164_5_plen_397_part_00
MHRNRLVRIVGGSAIMVGAGLGAFRHTNRPTIDDGYDALSMQGRLAVVTGASSGIGKHVAALLAAKGCNVILACRSKSRGEAACAEIRAANPLGSVETKLLDVSDADSIESFARDLKDRGPIHLLVHNAGTLNYSERRNKQGIELTLATNYIGPLLLTHQLLQPLQRGCAETEGHRSRVILVGSRLEKMAQTLQPDLIESHGQTRAQYDPVGNYADSKLCLMLWSRTLHNLTEADEGGPIAIAVTPGMVHTGLFEDYPWWYKWATWPARAMALRTAAEAAVGIVFCADAAQLENNALSISKSDQDGHVPYLYDGKGVCPICWSLSLFGMHLNCTSCDGSQSNRVLRASRRCSAIGGALCCNQSTVGVWSTTQEYEGSARHYGVLNLPTSLRIREIC